MVSQCTKFEVSRFTRYDAMNGGAKCRKWGSLGQLGGTQGHWQCHHSIAHTTSYSTLIETMHLSCIVFEIQPVEFHGDLWHQKTRIPGLSCGVVCVILCLAVLVELRLVTDTDRQTWTQRHRQTQAHG